MSGKERLTASRMNKLLACMRSHYWRYECGLSAVKSNDALRFGSAWHAAMEARWRGADCAGALEAAIGSKQELEELQVATLAGLLAGYCTRYADDPIKELHPEIEFEHPIEGSRTFNSGGKIDGLGVLKDGRLVLVEHKTTGDSVEAGSDYWLRLRANQQVLQYVLAARSLGWDIQEVLYDVTRKPMIRQRASETAEAFGERLRQDSLERPDFYFARREVPILEDDLEEFRTQRLELGKLILELRQAEKRVRRREQAWPRNMNSMACRGCEYSGFCLQNTAINLEQPPAGFRVGPAHGELSA